MSVSRHDASEPFNLTIRVRCEAGKDVSERREILDNAELDTAGEAVADALSVVPKAAYVLAIALIKLLEENYGSEVGTHSEQLEKALGRFVNHERSLRGDNDHAD